MFIMVNEPYVFGGGEAIIILLTVVMSDSKEENMSTLASFHCTKHCSCSVSDESNLELPSYSFTLKVKKKS
jgi:hypothetical protein